MQDESTEAGPRPATGGEPERAVTAAPAAVQRAGTGDPRVDAVIARLDGLAGQPLADQVAAFEDAHTQLQQVLGELDTGAAGPGGPGPGER